MTPEAPRDLRTLCRGEPKAVREFAEGAGSELREWLLPILDDVGGGQR